MKKMKKLRTVVGMSLVCAVGVTSATGCGGVKLPKEPADMAMMATKRTEALDSYELTGTMNLEANLMGETVDMDGTIRAVYFKDPMKMKMDLNMVYAEESIDMSMYFMKEEDNYVMYSCLEDQWTKQTMDASDEKQAEMIEKLESGNIDMISDYADKVSLDESQAEEGTTALKMTVTGQDLVELMSMMEANESLDSTGVSMDMFKGLGDIDMVMKIDNEQVYWKSVKMDMTSMIQGLFDSIIGSYSELLGDQEIEMSVADCSLEMNYEKYNEATAFELPEEAKNAKETNEDDIFGAMEEDTEEDIEEEIEE